MDKIEQIEKRLDAHAEHLQSIKETLKNGEPINEEFASFVDQVADTYYDLPTPRL